MPDTLEDLNRQREILKSKLTKIETYMNQRALVEWKIDVLDEKEKKLDEIYEKFENLETQIEQFITSENATNLEAKTKEFEEQFWRIKNTINNCRDKA
jgi:hypothetical protein